MCPSVLDILSKSTLSIIILLLTAISIVNVRSYYYYFLIDIDLINRVPSSSSTAYEDTQPIQDLNIPVSGEFYFHNFLSNNDKTFSIKLIPYIKCGYCNSEFITEQEKRNMN
jgi:hypothetical protein